MKWQTVPMKKVADVVSGFGFPRKYQGDTEAEFPFFKVGDMNLPGNEVEMNVTTNRVSEDVLKEIRAKAFPEGTIIFPKIGAAIATNKKRILTRPSVVDNNVMGLIPKSNIDGRYLYYWMVQFDLRKVSNIGPVPSMRKSTVQKVNVPYPTTLSEQQRIVEILDQADALRKKRAEADKKAEKILPTLFYKMFGDPVANLKGWEKVPLNKIVEIGTQLVDPNQDKYLELPHIGGNEIEKNSGRILSPMLVRESRLRSSKFYFTDNHILYCKIRPYLNKVAYPRCDGVCSADIYPLLPNTDRIMPLYLVVLLRSPAFLSYAKIHSERLRMPKLNKDQLGNYNVPLPPIDLQIRFNEDAELFDRINSNRSLCCLKLESLFQSLLHRAFSGELTAQWREAHMKELLSETEQQSKALEIVVKSKSKTNK